MPRRATRSFLFRAPPDLLAELSDWAESECRSLHGQIEHTLREALRTRAGHGQAAASGRGERTAGPATDDPPPEREPDGATGPGPQAP